MAEDNTKPKLMIVEDDKENQKFLNIFLRKKYELDFCDSAESLYVRLNEKKYDLILMDISLRGSKDGLQITKELRSNPKFQNMPIVCLSGHAYQRDKENAYRAGIDVFLTKPVQGEILLDSLAKALEQRANIKLQ